MIYSLLSVGIGGAIGAILRYLISSLASSHGGAFFPYGTVLVNLAGSFCIGFLMAFFSLHTQLSPQTKLFLVTGCLGGLTTFSTFQYEWLTLFQSGMTASFFWYGGLQIAGGFLLCWLGTVLGSSWFS